jgi:hypothetical protein
LTLLPAKEESIDANYVEIQSDNDLETLLSSGFDVVSTNRAQAPLDQLVILEISNLATTQLLIRLQFILNAKSYQVQACHDGERAMAGRGHLHTGAAHCHHEPHARHDLFCARADDWRQHQSQRMERAGHVDGDIGRICRGNRARVMFKPPILTFP